MVDEAWRDGDGGADANPVLHRILFGYLQPLFYLLYRRHQMFGMAVACAAGIVAVEEEAAGAQRNAQFQDLLPSGDVERRANEHERKVSAMEPNVGGGARYLVETLDVSGHVVVHGTVGGIERQFEKRYASPDQALDAILGEKGAVRDERNMVAPGSGERNEILQIVAQERLAPGKGELMAPAFPNRLANELLCLDRGQFSSAVGNIIFPDIVTLDALEVTAGRDLIEQGMLCPGSESFEQ